MRSKYKKKIGQDRNNIALAGTRILCFISFSYYGRLLMALLVDVKWLIKLDFYQLQYIINHMALRGSERWV